MKIVKPIIAFLIICTVISGLGLSTQSAQANPCLKTVTEEIITKELIPSGPARGTYETKVVERQVPIWNPSCLFKMVAQEAGYTTDIDAEPTTIAEKLGVAMGMVLSFLGTIFVILIIYGGFLWMTARGNEEQSKKAKNIIRDAVIGVIIILASGTIMYFIMMLPTINFQPA